MRRSCSKWLVLACALIAAVPVVTLAANQPVCVPGIPELGTDARCQVTTRDERQWSYDPDVFFALTRCATDGRLPTAVAVAVVPLTVPIDLALLPAAALVGFFQLF
jgi:hypothetical protein